MIAYKIPPTEDGVLCALFESFTLKEIPIAVFSSVYEPTFDCRVKTISVLPQNAERVKKGIIKCGGISLLSALFYVMRSQSEIKETVIFNAARKCLAERKNVLDNFQDPDILSFYELKTKISYETHRMLGFIRFEKSAQGIWYSHIEPDNDIVDLVAPHFKTRLPNERFIIHDVKRNIFSVYNGKDIVTFKSNNPITVYLDEDEVAFQKLWGTYFESVAIKERKNKKLQDNFLPHRYRKHMSEFTGNYSSDITVESENSSACIDENTRLLPGKN